MEENGRLVKFIFNIFISQKETIKNRFKFNGQYSLAKICGSNAKHLSFALAKADES